MKINREMSRKTWKQIHEAAGRIYRRASESKDHQTAKDADLILTLLRNLSEEIQIEDDRLRHIA
ncbi:MAG: hypothetical protein JWN92_1497 [Candidatus Acidoferrum typicum]|jgi:hypothetical protein|nr:hypothetical protein [Candidatus Acidoferrum typicum]